MPPDVHLDILRSLLEGSVEMRYQDPKIEKAGASRKYYRIRPYVPTVLSDGKIERRRKDIRLGWCDEITASQAKALKQATMATVNAGPIVIQSQIQFSALAAKFEAARIPQLGAATQEKYRAHLKNHLRPAFDAMRLCDIDRPAVQAWLLSKPLAHATRLDLRNLLSAIFEQAKAWKLWTGDNPAQGVDVGRGGAVREKRKMSESDVARFLAAIQDTRVCTAETARVLALTSLVTGLRVSECLGLQRRDIRDGWLTVERRYRRGDLDQPKSQKSRRRRFVGALADRMLALSDGEWIFRNHHAEPLDDRDLQQHVFRPAATAVGIYHAGFGMHTMRRMYVSYQVEEGASPLEAMARAGHASIGTTMLYLLEDHGRESAIGERLMARFDGRVQ